MHANDLYPAFPPNKWNKKLIILLYLDLNPQKQHDTYFS